MQSLLSLWTNFIFILILGSTLTYFVKVISTKYNIIDIPNERGSHIKITARGGGLSILLIFTMLTLYFYLRQDIPSSLFSALMGGVIVGLIGFFDDIKSLPAYLRFGLHIALGIWCVTNLYSILDITFIFFMLCTVWFINLYNFMDGIDGLAGGEGALGALFASFTLLIHGFHTIGFLLLLFSGVIGGFTLLNWQPAKIFMGDVGSGYLGYIFSVIIIYTVSIHALNLYFWILIFAVFIGDATFTLFYRIATGQKWYAAHREHAYQCCQNFNLTHSNTTCFVLLTNIFILYPLALLCLYHSQLGLIITLTVFIGLFFIWHYLHFPNVFSKKMQLGRKVS